MRTWLEVPLALAEELEMTNVDCAPMVRSPRTTRALCTSNVACTGTDKLPVTSTVEAKVTFAV